MVLLEVRRQKKGIEKVIKMIYYISDIHFRDQKIFDKCVRPFQSLEEMEREIIEKWNRKVNNNDLVYILGDISKDDDASTLEIFKKLKGHKHLIVGNHDHLILDEIQKSNIFETVKFIDLIYDKDRKVCICHYPIMDWMEFNRNGILVYGHVHNKTEINGYAYKLMKEYYKDLKAYNCGVDVNNFEPNSLDELIQLKEENKDGPYIY